MKKSWADLIDDSLNKKGAGRLIKALAETCKRYEKLTFDELCRKPKWLRIFIWNNFILEMLLGSRVFKKPEYAEKVKQSILHIDSLPDKGFALFNEYPPHGPALTVLALGVALEGFDKQLSSGDVDAFKRIIHSYCKKIYASAKVDAWGDDKPVRLMWNHSMVGYAGLYFGGFVLNTEYKKEAQEWYRLARIFHNSQKHYISRA